MSDLEALPEEKIKKFFLKLTTTSFVLQLNLQSHSLLIYQTHVISNKPLDFFKNFWYP